MKTAYFDCAMGISGDMCLGALVDAGVSLTALKRELKRLPLDGYVISSRRVTRAGISATKVDVRLKHDHHHGRRWKDVRALITRSTLPPHIRDTGLAIFRRLFEAEATVHGASPETVHLHELGAVDCMVDIMGSLIGFDLLGICRFCASPVNVGSGTVKTEHGVLPVPAPATIELLKGVPVYGATIPFELTTPTGASILTGINASFGPLPLMSTEIIACGAGGRDIEGVPNILRLLIGDDRAGAASGSDRVALIETNIDDMNPQLYEHVMERLFAAGALDVFLEPLIMKKGRPGTKLSVIGTEKDIDILSETMFAETTTIGLRIHHPERRILDRELRTVRFRGHPVRVKVARIGSNIVNMHPEYDDARAAAKKTGLPLKKVLDEIAALVRKP